jgi:uncharacterized alpha-E superfamily protein
VLSRTADHLYWMSRYLERAESLARMLDAHHRLSLLPRPQEAIMQGWSATLVSLGMERPFLDKDAEIAPRAAFDFVAFDRDHVGSIVSCLRAARENARAVRGTITSDMWETLNSTYLESRAFSATMPEAGRGEFLEWVKYRAHLTRGIQSGTMVRDEALCFVRIGTFLARADNTTRLLTNAGIDQISTFRKTTVFQKPGERVLVLQSSGNLAITQTVVSILRDGIDSGGGKPNLLNVANLFEAARCVGHALRELHRRDAAALKEFGVDFNASRAGQGRAAAAVQHLQRRQLHRSDE